MEKYQRNHSKHSYTCFNFNIQHFHSSLSSQKHIFIIIFPFFSFDNNPKYLQILINTYKNPAHPIFLSFPFFLFPSLFHSSLGGNGSRIRDKAPSPLLLPRLSTAERTVKTKIARERISTRGDVAAFQPLEPPPPSTRIAKSRKRRP